MRYGWIPWGLVLCILVPYWQLTTMQSILVTDDKFISDIFGGELPFRVWFGEALRRGDWPLWNPLSAQGSPTSVGDPFILLYALVPPVVAVNVQVLAILVLATLSTYAYAREIRLTRSGATLSALAFAYSGFMVTQLKHLTFVETVAWFPLGLMFLERGLRGSPRGPKRLPKRVLALACFGGVVAMQVLAGFPQAVYYAFGAYGLYALARSLPGLFRSARSRRRGRALFLALLATTILGVGSGAVALSTLMDVARGSDRSAGAGYEWASQFGYVPHNVLNFFIPYVYGDVADGTYVGGGMFWEQYGYVGLFTILVAIAAALVLIRKDPLVRVFVAMGVIAYVVVLGPAVPGFRLVFEWVPGMSKFRFTTRAMFIVDFALAMLAGIGLSRAQQSDAWKIPAARRNAFAIVWLALAFVDLLHHQMHQNAFGDAKTFLAEPDTATFLKRELGSRRYFAWDARNLHMAAHYTAAGWSDLAPYEALLPMLEPSTNFLWSVPSVTAYNPLASHLHADFWGSANRHGVMWDLAPGSPAWRRILSIHAVGYVLAPRPINALGPAKTLIRGVHVYPVTEAVPRAYVATSVVPVAGVEDELGALLAPTFRPGRDVVVEGANAPSLREELRDERIVRDSPARADIVVNRNTRVEIEAEAPLGGVLVLADAWFAAWQATVDGVPAPILRANHTQRAVVLMPGKHRVVFALRWQAFTLGAVTSLASMVALVVLGALAARSARKGVRVGAQAA